jgi:hypothetical protein
MDVWALEDGVAPQLAGAGPASSASTCLRRDGWCPTYEAAAFLHGGVLVVAGSRWLLLYDVKEKRAVRRVNCGRGIRNLSRCVYRESLVPLPAPRPTRGRARATCPAASLCFIISLPMMTRRRTRRSTETCAVTRGSCRSGEKWMRTFDDQCF